MTCRDVRDRMRPFRTENLGRKVLLALCGLLMPGLAAAAGGAPDVVTARHTSFFDEGFLQDAESSDLVQIGADVEAARHAGTPAVRRLAQTLAADHGGIDDELKAIARARDVELPATLDPGRQQALDELVRNTAGRFDGAYVQLEIQESRKMVSLYGRAAESNDDEVRAFAQRMLPVLRSHVRMAEALS